MCSTLYMQLYINGQADDFDYTANCDENSLQLYKVKSYRKLNIHIENWKHPEILLLYLLLKL